MLIKYWARVCGITGFFQGFTTYSLVMLVIYYLQQLDPPILPSVYLLQSLEVNKEFCRGWECSFCDEEWKLNLEAPMKKNNCSLRNLLDGFFTFFSAFDYTNIICPLISRMIPVSDFDDPDKLPDEMHLYKERVKNDSKMSFKTNVLIKVQDPFELCLNITKGVTEKTFLIFKKACSVSSELCEKSDEASLLKTLFNIAKESLDDGSSCFRFNIPFKRCEDQPSSSTDDELSQWYDLVSEALLLVMKEVLKLQVESNSSETSSKVKKVGSSHDVHTLPSSFKDCKDLIYTCTGYADVWNSRKKVSRLLNRSDVNITDFEREVCISNTLYKPKEKRIVSFNLIMTSFDTFKCKSEGIEISMSEKTPGCASMKEMVNFLKRNLRFLFNQAINFIAKLKTFSIEIKTLKDLELGKLQDLKIINNSKTGFLKLSEEEREEILKLRKKPCKSLQVMETAENGQSKEACSVSKPIDVQEPQTGSCDPPQTSIDRDISEIKENNTKQTSVERDISEIKDDYTEEVDSTVIELPSALKDENPFLASIEKVCQKSPVNVKEEKNNTKVTQEVSQIQINNSLNENNQSQQTHICSKKSNKSSHCRVQNTSHFNKYRSVNSNHYQLQLYNSIEKQKLWFPSLFKTTENNTNC